MEHVNHPGEPRGINGPVGVPVEVFDDLQDSTAAESFKRLHQIRLPTALCLVQSVPDASLNIFRERLQLPPTGANKEARFGEARCELHISIMAI